MAKTKHDKGIEAPLDMENGDEQFFLDNAVETGAPANALADAGEAVEDGETDSRPNAESKPDEETHPDEADEGTAAIAEALEAAQAKQEEYLNLAQRVQADFENFRRRNQSVRREAYEDGARGFAATLL
ncbi:MAG: hypothetical protein FWF86_07390, partial [Clostridia bacterium]|nr:hypothetical protein [Clostridia bacterium]